MHNIALKIILLISNWSPLLHSSNDCLFGSLGESDPDRYSLIEFSLGKRKLYFVTFFKSNNRYHFKLYDQINFDAICKINTEEEMQEKIDAYSNEIKDKNDDLINIHIFFLKDKIGMNQTRIVSAYNKINSYTAITLAYIGFIVFLVNKVIKSDESIIYFQWVVFVLMILSIYYTANCVLFIKSGLSIKGYIRSTFKDLKKQPTFQQLSLNYYTDWYSTNNEAQVITSLVRNIEKYFIRSFVLSILILLAIFLNEFIQINSTNNTNHKNEYLIMDDSGSFLTSEFSILI